MSRQTKGYGVDSFYWCSLNEKSTFIMKNEILQETERETRLPKQKRSQAPKNYKNRTPTIENTKIK